MTPARKANDIPHPLLQRSNATHARMTDTFSFHDSFAKQSRGKRCGMSQNGSRARFRAAVFGELTSQILVSCSSLLRVSGGVQCVQYSAGRRPAPEKPAEIFRTKNLRSKNRRKISGKLGRKTSARSAIASHSANSHEWHGQTRPTSISRSCCKSALALRGIGSLATMSRRPKHSASSLLKSCVALTSGSKR